MKEKIPKLERLNDKKIKQIKKLIGLYKYFYICNSCGSLYGSDRQERKVVLCPLCTEKMFKSKRERKQE